MSKSRFTPELGICCRLGAVLLAGTTLRVAAQSDEVIYTNTSSSLQSGWQNWSWANVDLANTSPVHGGTYSISVNASNNSALYLEIPPTSSSGFTNLTFWINGGATGGQVVQAQGLLGGTSTTSGTAQPAIQIGPLPTNSWRQVTLSLSAMGVANATDFSGFWLQVESPTSVPTFYVDDIVLVAGSAPPATNAPLSFNIDASQNRHAISPQIYGVAFATSNQLSDLNFTMHRSGGNEETTDNWLINAHGKGNDYYFENYADSSDTTPAATFDDFVANSKDANASAMITLSMIGWMPKLGAGRGVIWSYSQAKYGPQTGWDPYHTDAGNGIGTNTTSHTSWIITTNDPTDAYFPTNVAFEQGLVQHLKQTWGASTNGGVGYYLLDNEESIWHSTHQDIHPVGATMQEIWNDMLTTASMAKSNDPNAQVMGPEEWGWNGYFYSGYDQQWSGQHNDFNPADYPDRKTNGGWDYIPWLLNQFHQHDTNTGKRLLDYLTVHCYPQEGDVSGSDNSASTDLLRNQSTRQFWDTNYVDPSWINSVIMLIPRLKSWAATYYPGTKTGVTEYNWGAESDISGGTAQADLLGIFGWQALDLATRWTVPATSTPTYNAMKMYRNYDGNKSTFGDTSILATGTDPDNVSEFAAIRSTDGALTAMIVNKQLSGVQPITLTFANFLSTGTAQVWQLTSANLITHLSNVSLTGNTLSNSLPAQSITLFVLGAGTNPPPPTLTAGRFSSSNTFDFWLNGQSGTSYIVQGSSNLTTWVPMLTNTLSSNSVHVVLPASGTARTFYRAVWVP